MKGVDPDQVVVMGAAIEAQALIRRRRGEPAARRHPARASHRNRRRLHREGDRQEHPHPHREVEDLHHQPRRAGQGEIRVYQGESNRADECELLGEFEFTGFRIGYRGEVKIEVTFEIDSNGIVNVSATDLETKQAPRPPLPSPPASPRGHQERHRQERRGGAGRPPGGLKRSLHPAMDVPFLSRSRPSPRRSTSSTTTRS